MHPGPSHHDFFVFYLYEIAFQYCKRTELFWVTFDCKIFEDAKAASQDITRGRTE